MSATQMLSFRQRVLFFKDVLAGEVEVRVNRQAQAFKGFEGELGLGRWMSFLGWSVRSGVGW